MSSQPALASTIKTFKSIEELRQATGSILGTSGWHEVTQQEVDKFAEATHDHQWIHSDVARAAEGPFGGTIAHGYLTLALVSHLVSGAYALENVTMQINYGSNRVRYPAPLAVGARVRATVELKSVDSTPSGHKVITEVIVEVENGDRPVCLAEIITLVVE